MKRALILIIVLSALTFGGGWLLDDLQQNTAMRYLKDLHSIRQFIKANELDTALHEQARLHARWEDDSHWLNALWDHRHTREVEASICRLATTLEEGNRLHALLAMDELVDALEEVAQRNMAFWENIM